MDSVEDAVWFVLARATRGHAAIYRATHGRVGAHMRGIETLLVLEHVGAKSGKVRRTPLVYMPDGDDFLIVASKGGHRHNPGWFYNLRAHPEANVQIGEQSMPVRAREVTAEERERLWPEAAKYNPNWEGYRKRTARELPLVLLEPLRPSHEPATS